LDFEACRQTDFLSPVIVDLQKKYRNIKDSSFTISQTFIDYKLYFGTSKENNVILPPVYSNKINIILQSIKVFNDKYPDYHNIKFYIIGEELEETVKNLFIIIIL
jgi:hypothetical protein